MLEPPSRSTLVAYGAVLLAVVVLAVRAVGGSPPSEPAASIAIDEQAAAPEAVGPAPATDDAAPPPGAASPPSRADSAPDAGAGVAVHVAGAVRRPGLYRLAAGARIDDAIAEAGGATRKADLSAVNLAAKAEDGRQVLVPERGRPGALAAAAPGATTPGGAATPAGSAGPAAPIDLNSASLEQLDTLDGVGPATAQKILDYREANGGFRSVDELDQIPGIGEKRMASLREQVTV